MPFGRYRYTCGVQDTCYMGSVAPTRKGDFGVEPPGKTCNCKLQQNRRSYAATWRLQTRSWVDLPVATAIPRFAKKNYFGSCSYKIKYGVSAIRHTAVLELSGQKLSYWTELKWTKRTNYFLIEMEFCVLLWHCFRIKCIVQTSL